MALSAYLQQTGRLLQNPGAPATLYSTGDITSYINTARGQLAGETACIRGLVTIPTVIGQTMYNFSSINIGNSAANGIQGVINIRRITYSVASGQQWIPPRSWEWFDLYYINNTAPVQGPPAVWAQYGQGAAPPGGQANSSFGGVFFINPPPDQIYTLNLDCACYPIPLVNDTTVEAIPYLWTDAVSFYAAWYALLSAQMQARRADAEAYYNYYQTFVQRARAAANPPVNQFQFEGAPDPAFMNKLGVSPKGNGNANA